MTGTPTFTGGPPGSPVIDINPGHALRDQIEPALFTIGSGLTVSGDRRVDETAVIGGQRVVVETEALHDAGTIVLDQDVRACARAA